MSNYFLFNYYVCNSMEGSHQFTGWKVHVVQGGIHWVTEMVAVPIIPFSSLDWQVTISLHSWTFFFGRLGDMVKDTSTILPRVVFLASK